MRLIIDLDGTICSEEKTYSRALAKLKPNALSTIKALKKKNIEIHARSVFLQGLLLSFDSLSDYFLIWEGQFKRYQEMVREKDLSLLEYALNFVLNTQEFDKILVGVDNVKQLTDIINAYKLDVKLNAFKKI